MSDQTETVSTTSPPAGAVQRAGALAARLPLTLTLLGVVVLLGLVTGTMWDGLESRPLFGLVGYGVPALQAGQWWTVPTGAFFAAQPLQYLPILVGLAVFVGFAEWRLGWRRAGLALVVCQLVGVGGTTLLVWLIAGHGYDWATGLSLVRDAGPSAAFLGAAAAATVGIRPPWRGRARVLLAAYVWLALVHVGGLADLEHFVAVLVGLPLGPVLLGRRPRLTVRPLAREDYRLLASAFFVLAAVEGLILPFTADNGPLSSTLSEAARAEDVASRDLVSAVVEAVVWLWLARALYKGRRRAWRWAGALLSLVVLAQVAVFVVLVVTGEPGKPQLLYDLVGNVVGLVILLVGRRAFRNPSPRRARRRPGSIVAPASDDQRVAATAQLQQLGSVNDLSWMTTWPENRWFVRDGRPGYVAYRVHANVAVGVCDPVAATREDREALLGSFADAVHSAGLVPCLFSVTDEAAAHARAAGWQVLDVAEEAVIGLEALAFKGKAWQDVRTALNQAAKQGIEFRLGSLAHMPRGLQTQVRAISAEWVSDKELPEMGFTLGGVDEAMDPHVQVGLAVDGDGTVHGVTSWMPAYGGGPDAPPYGWTLDVMRRLPDGFRYTMEFLVASACLRFKEDGARVVSLSGAPLAGSSGGSDATDRSTLDAFLDRLSQTLEPFYGFGSLHAFKGKFQPTNRPLFLVYPTEAALPRIGIALGRAYLPDAGLRDLVTLVRSSP